MAEYEVGNSVDIIFPQNNPNLMKIMPKTMVSTSTGGGGEGTNDHRQLTNRNASNQHPISAITGLTGKLDEIYNAFETIEGYISNIQTDKQDKLIAGQNITIEDNVISATGSGAVTSVNGQVGDVVLGASDVGALPTTGGTLTGNLTGRYITGTWLQSTSHTDLNRTPNKYPVFDGSGWIYSRTLEETQGDLGITYLDNQISAMLTAIANGTY